MWQLLGEHPSFTSLGSLTESENSKKQPSTLITHILTVAYSVMARKNFLRIYSLKKEDNFRGEGRRRKKEKESSISAFLLICSNYSVYIAYNCPTKGRR